MGLGSFPELSIVDARNLALEKLSIKASGIDPIYEKNTFKRHEKEKAKRLFRNET